MKVLSAMQMQAADRATIDSEPISSTDLMERASLAFVNRLLEKIHLDEQDIFVFCGSGNNGGDGLVISRHLLSKGFRVFTVLVNFSPKSSEDRKLNLLRLKKMGHNPIEINDYSDFDQLPKMGARGFVVDAIFGTGLKRSPEGWVKALIERINASAARIVSVDFPSGLFSDLPVTDQYAVIRADLTFTFQQPKLAFLLPSNESYIGAWEILNIGLDAAYIDRISDCPILVDSEWAEKIFIPRKIFSHKGSFGHSLLIGGSYGKIGAIVLASKASLKIGSGLTTAYLPKCGYSVLQMANPEVMVEVDDEYYLQFFNFATRPTAIGIGPGLGMHLKTKKGFVDFLRKTETPMVIDADALNIISEHEEISDLIPTGSILTPHPGEFRRLVGDWKDDNEKLEKQKAFSSKHDCIVVLKGAHSCIADGNQLYFNNTGNPALATAGSGDVLTGILTGLLAQGYNSLNAAILGVYLHGRSADLAVKHNQSEESFIASDTFSYLGQALKELGEEKPIWL